MKNNECENQHHKAREKPPSSVLKEDKSERLVFPPEIIPMTERQEADWTEEKKGDTPPPVSRSSARAKRPYLAPFVCSF